MDGNKTNEKEQEALHPKYVEIPRGWSRILENGSILYISPSSNRLRCRDQVVDYLTTGGTCKCGLECPLHIDKVFVFDAKVPSKLANQNADHPKRQTSCQHCEGNITQKEMPQTFTSHSSPSVETDFESPDSKVLPYAALPKGVLGQKKAPVRSRKSALDANKQPKVSMPISLQTKEPSKGNMYDSISNSLGSVTKASPVQNVPTNLATSNQGPLPSFASIVSSFKFFNPGLETTSRGGNSTGLPTGTSDVKAATTVASTAFSVPSSVQRTVTKTVTFVGTTASNMQRKNIQQVKSKPMAKPRNIAILKSSQTVQMTSTGNVTPRTNEPTVTAALATKNVAVTLPRDIKSTSTPANAPALVMSVSKVPLSPSTTPNTAVVSSTQSVALATSLVSQSPVSVTSPSLSYSTGVATSSVATLSSPTAAMTASSSSISAIVSSVAVPGSKVTSAVNPVPLKTKTSLATAEVARGNLVVTSSASQSGSSLNSLQPVTAKVTAKSITKPAVRSRVAKPKTTLGSRKQGLKALANAAVGLLSTATSENAATSAGVASPLQASSVQSSILKPSIPSSVTAPVMTPALWNPAMMARNSQSSQQAHSPSYLSGAWSSVLSPNVTHSSLMGLRHPPPSATAPTIVTTTISLQNKVEGQSTVTPATAAASASTLIKPSLSVSHASVTSTRPQLSVPFLTSSNQQSFSTSASQMQSGSQGSGVQLKLTAQNVFSQSQVPATANQGAVSAVPPVQPAIVAPIPFYQSAAINQMYNPQGLDVNQLKAFGQYQVQWPTLYPSHLAANTMVLATSQEKIATTPTATMNQQGYQNPFMFGIIMPTPQPSTVGIQTPTASATGTTANQTMAPSVASTAVAAAYGSYVPIAPAATPRFSQTLAHLANAYNPYGSNVRGAAPPNNQLQFTYRMMQMSAIASGGLGNTVPLGSAGAPSPSIPDQSIKYPLSSVKQMSYGSTVSSVSTSSTTSGMVKTSISPALQTPAQTVVAAMSYVPLSTQVGGAQSSSTFTPATTAMGATTRTPLVSAGIPVQPYTYGMMTAAANIDPKTGNTTFGYLLIPPAGEAVSSTASETTSDLSTATESIVTSVQTSFSGGVQNLGVSKTNVVNPQHISPSTGSIALASSSVLTMPSSSLWTPWSTTSAGVSRSSGETHAVSSHTLSHSQTNRVNSSSIHTAFSSTLPVQIGKSRSSTIQQPQLYSSPNIHDVKSDSYSAVSPLSTPYEKCGSPLTESQGIKRYFDDVTSDKVISNSEKRTKYDFQPSRFVETDPLLGMKRSCEAIEVYPIHKESGKNKCSDNENCGEGNSDYEDEDNGGDSPMLMTETVDKLKKSSAVEPPVEVKSSSPEVKKVQVSTAYNSEHLSDVEARNGDLEEPPHRGSGELPDIRADGLIAKLRDSAEFVECLPTHQVRPHFGIGDIVWAQARGLPSWPGKIVDEAIVGKGRPDDGKCWVMWFGDHNFSQVEVDRLKTLTEGLRSLDDKGKKKKYRAKKARIGLEQAISEALEELEKREQLKVKQSGKARPKKKRVR